MKTETSKRLALLVLVACQAPSPTPPSQPPARADVHIDRRVEVLATVMRLAGNPEYNQAPSTEYVNAADAWFGKYRDHAAVAASRALSKQYEIGYDAPMELALHLDNDLQVQPQDVADLRATSPRWAKADIEGYAKLLRDFATVSHFDEFLAAHRAYLDMVADKLRLAVDAENPIPWFDQRFGARRGTFTIVPGMLVGPWNFGVRANRASRAIDSMQVLGVWKADGLPPTDEGSIAILIHEMAHSYINPVFDRHQEVFAAAGKVIYPLVARRMKKSGYDEWKIVVNESGVRATVAQFFRDRKGAAKETESTRFEERAGFAWMSELVEVVKHIPDGALEAHVPEVAKFFDDYAARHTGGIPRGRFTGPVDVAVYGDPVFVAPSNADGTRFLTALRDRVDANAPIVPATDDVVAAHPGKDIVLYGGAADPAIAAVLARAGWRVDSSGIAIGGKHFDGPHLVLIACVPRPDDPDHGIAVYTALDVHDIGDLDFWHGVTDWYVVRKTEKGYDPIKADDF